MQRQKLIGSGLSALSSTVVTGDVASGLTAAGSTQGTALVLNDVNEFTTTAASTGGILPVGSTVGDEVWVYNAGASTLSIYGQTGESINSASANAAFSVATTKGAVFKKVSSTRWMAILTA